MPYQLLDLALIGILLTAIATLVKQDRRIKRWIIGSRRRRRISVHRPSLR